MRIGEPQNNETDSFNHLSCYRRSRVALLLQRRGMDLQKGWVMKKKPPLASLTPEERDARLKKIIMSGLGKAWMFWPPRNEVKRRCAHPDKPGWFICELNKSHEIEKIDVDHIVPCVKPSDGFTSWDTYINSRFVLADKLQGICTSCHKAKTKVENIRRREIKKCQADLTRKENG